MRKLRSTSRRLSQAWVVFKGSVKAIDRTVDACEFPMREYVEKYDPEHLLGDEVVPIDVLFKELVGYISKKRARADRSVIEQDFPPRPALGKDLENKRWVMVENEEVVLPQIEEPMGYEPEDPEELGRESDFFCDYINAEQQSVKRELLQAAYKTVHDASTSGNTLKTLVKSTIGYVINEVSFLDISKINKVTLAYSTKKSHSDLMQYK